jgi:hypothetical protein
MWLVWSTRRATEVMHSDSEKRGRFLGLSRAPLQLLAVIAVLNATACHGEISGGDPARTNTVSHPATMQAGRSSSSESGAQSGTGATGGADRPYVSSVASCPAGLECSAISGRYLCVEPGPEVLACDSLQDCPDGIATCVARGGQGICVRFCAPSEGFPNETAISGAVVEYAPGTGFTPLTNTPRETALENVKVCLLQPRELADRIGCTTTDAAGAFMLDKLPANIDPAQQFLGVLSFEKTGYLPQVQSFYLGDGSQTIGNHVRLLTSAYAQEIATKTGSTLPSESTGWLLVDATKFDPASEPSRYSFSQGTLQLALLDHVSISMTPVAGIGPIYTDDSEQLAAGAPPLTDVDAGSDNEDDAGTALPSALRETSQSGFALFTDLPTRVNGSLYQLTFDHAALTCGSAPTQVILLPGYLTADVGVVCGNGVH